MCPEDSQSAKNSGQLTKFTSPMSFGSPCRIQGGNLPQ
jgi:hypothetical protein